MSARLADDPAGRGRRRALPGSRRRRPEARHQFLRALVGELERRGLDDRAEPALGGHPVCLFSSFNFDAAPAALRAPGRKDGAPRRRADRRVPRLRRRHRPEDRRAERGARERDGGAVALQPREAPGARPRAALACRDFEHGRPGALPPAGRARAARRQEGEGGRDELVQQRPQGYGDALWLDRNLDPDRYELTFVGRAPARFKRIRVVGPVASTSRAAARQHDLYLAPSRDDPARTPCSRRSPAVTRGVPRAVPSELVGDAGLPFREDDGSEVLDRLVASSTSGARRSGAVARDVADRYLVLELERPA